MREGDKRKVAAVEMDYLRVGNRVSRRDRLTKKEIRTRISELKNKVKQSIEKISFKRIKTKSYSGWRRHDVPNVVPLVPPENIRRRRSQKFGTREFEQP